MPNLSSKVRSAPWLSRKRKSSRQGRSVGLGRRSLRVEPLEQRQLLTAVLGIGDTELLEGGPGEMSTARLHVTLDGAVPEGFAVSYSTQPGTATAEDNDFVPQEGWVQFEGTSGETHVIEVAVVGDEQVEPNERFSVRLIGIEPDRPVTIVKERGHVHIINDDDPPPPPGAVLGIGDTELLEGAPGEMSWARLDVTLDGAVPEGFAVSYSTQPGTATVDDNDYVPQEGWVEFEGTSGETHVIEVAVVGDERIEPNEMFSVLLIGIEPDRPVTIGRDRGHVHIINDDDDGPPPPPSGAVLGIGDTELLEGAPGEMSWARLDVTLDGAVPEGFAVSYSTQPGTATVDDNDYVPQEGWVEFEGTSGETHVIEVAVVGDERIEPNEMFSVLLIGIEPDRPVTIGRDRGHVHIINDDDDGPPPPPPGAVVGIGDTELLEGAPGEMSWARLDVTLDGAVPEGFAVSYSTHPGTATVDDNDYVPQEGWVEFEGTSGETHVIEVAVVGDERFEPNEMFSVRLIGIEPDRPVTIGRDRGHVEIINDDGDVPPALLSISDASVLEGPDGQITPMEFTVRLDGATSAPVDVLYRTELQNGTANPEDGLFGGGWGRLFACSASQGIVEIHPHSGTVIRQFEAPLLGGPSDGLAFDGHSLWYLGQQDTNTLYELDPNDGAVRATFDLPASAFRAGLATMNGLVYILDWSILTQDITVFDPELGTVVDTLDFNGVNPEAPRLTAGGLAGISRPNALLVTAEHTVEGETIREIIEISPETGVITDRFRHFQEGGSLGLATRLGRIYLGRHTGLEDQISVFNRAGEEMRRMTIPGSIGVQALGGDDLSGPGWGRLHFTGVDGETRTITIGIRGDETPEPDETFAVRLLELNGHGGNVAIGDNPGWGTILNDDETPSLPRQCVRGAPPTVTGLPGESVSADVRYNTSDGQGTFGLGVRMHFDSSVLTLAGVTEVLADGLVSQTEPIADVEDLDGDPATDMYVLSAWADIEGDWPDAELPESLFTVEFVLAAELDPGTSSLVRFSAAETSVGYDFHSRPIEVVTVNQDVDGDGQARALIDGIMALRYMFGVRGDGLVEGLNSDTATRSDGEAVGGFLAGAGSNMLDVDGNGQPRALSDGIMFLRYLFGVQGDAIVDGLLGSGATRTTGAEVSNYLNQFIAAPAAAAQPMTEQGLQSLAVNDPLAQMAMNLAMPATESVSEPIPEPVSEPISEPLPEPISEPLPEPISKPIVVGVVPEREVTRRVDRAITPNRARRIRRPAIARAVEKVFDRPTDETRSAGFGRHAAIENAVLEAVARRSRHGHARRARATEAADAVWARAYLEE